MAATRRLTPILAGAAFLAIPLGVLAPMQLATLAAIAASLCVLLGWRALGEGDHAPRALLVPLVLLVVWMAASALWTINVRFTLVETARFGLMTLGGLILVATARALDARGRQSVGNWFMAGFVVGLAILAFEIATEGLLLRSAWWVIGLDKRFIFSVTYNRATSAIGVLAWPAVLFFLQRKAPVVAAIALATSVFLVQDLHKWASVIALLSSTVVFGAALLSARVTARVLAACVAFLLIVAPILPRTVLAPDAVVRAYPGIAFSEYHRILIWDFAAKRIAERPILGWGMNSARVMPGGKDTAPTDIPGRTRGTDDKPVELMPLHPHNTPLQLWLELGVPGVLLAAILITGLLLLAARHPAGPTARAASLATVTGVIAIAAMSFSMWQSWWLAVVWLAVMLLIAAAPAPEKVRS
ncbi:MAG: O-antigen ligase family protein [Alphaproteobacteria bacterium]